MKLYTVTVTEHYYDFCNEWDSVESYWMSEEKAYERRSVVRAAYDLDGKNPDQYWVNVYPINTED